MKPYSNLYCPNFSAQTSASIRDLPGVTTYTLPIPPPRPASTRGLPGETTIPRTVRSPRSRPRTSTVFVLKIARPATNWSVGRAPGRRTATNWSVGRAPGTTGLWEGLLGLVAWQPTGLWEGLLVGRASGNQLVCGNGSRDFFRAIGLSVQHAARYSRRRQDLLRLDFLPDRLHEHTHRTRNAKSLTLTSTREEGEYLRECACRRRLPGGGGSGKDP